MITVQNKTKDTNARKPMQASTNTATRQKLKEPFKFPFPDPNTKTHPGQCASCATQCVENWQCKPSHLKEHDGHTYQNVQPLLAAADKLPMAQILTHTSKNSAKKNRTLYSKLSPCGLGKTNLTEDLTSDWGLSKTQFLPSARPLYWLNSQILYTKQGQLHTTSESSDSPKHSEDKILQHNHRSPYHGQSQNGYTHHPENQQTPNWSNWRSVSNHLPHPTTTTHFWTDSIRFMPSNFHTELCQRIRKTQHQIHLTSLYSGPCQPCCLSKRTGPFECLARYEMLWCSVFDGSKLGHNPY